VAEALDIVTGGAGFIGSHLVRTLLARGGRVRVIDDFSSGRRENLSEPSREFGDRLEICELDIRELEPLRRLFAGARVIYHQAAVTSVARSVADPGGTNSANIGGSLNVLLAARDAGARKVVYASSSSVYGDTAVLPKHERLQPQPLSPYAVSKLAGELYAENFTRIFEVPTFGLRYFNVFGPRQDPKSEYAAVIPSFITHLLDGEAPVVFGDGEQTRDFTFIENVVSANLLASESPARGIAANIGCGDRFSLNHLLGTLREILGTDVEPVYQAPRAGDVRDSQADISLARESIGYAPQVSFLEGLRRTAAWFRDQREG
jgi:UDP-glucose 4-epimerase